MYHIFTSKGRFNGPYFFSVAAIALLKGEGSIEGEPIAPFLGVFRNWKLLLIKFLFKLHKLNFGLYITTE